MSLIRTPIYSTKESPQYQALREIDKQFTELEHLVHQINLSQSKVSDLSRGGQLQPELATSFSNQGEQLVAKSRSLGQLFEDIEIELVKDIKTVINRISTELYVDKNFTSLDKEMKQVKDKINLRLEQSALEEQNKESDSYSGKLIKYIPAEVVISFTALAALASQVAPEKLINLSLLVAGVVGILATPTYFWIRSLDQSAEKQPEWFLYLLSPIAFVFWAIAISEPTRNLLNIKPELAQFLLALGAFIVPLLDEAFTTIKKRRKNVRT